MKIDELLKDTFTAHEGLVPDERTVLADVHERITRRRGASAGRPLAIAASVVAVGVVAAGAVALSGHDGTATRPNHRAVARPPGAGHSRSHPAVTTHRSITPLTMPFDLDWLPSGTTAFVHRINIGGVSDTSKPSYDGEYMLSTATLDIDVQQMPGHLAGETFKSGPGRSVRINGRPGIESINSGGPGGYEVYFTDSTGGVMYVNVSVHYGAKDSGAARYRSVGRRIAQAIRFPGSATVDPTFGVGNLPSGMHVVAFDVENLDDSPVPGLGTGVATSYQIGTKASQDTAYNIASGPPAQPSGRPGRPVQGHPTRYGIDHGYVTLYVSDAVHGQDVALQARRPLAEVYRVADGLALPS